MKEIVNEFFKEQLISYVRGRCEQDLGFYLEVSLMKKNRDVIISFHGYQPFSRIDTSYSCGFLFMSIEDNEQAKPTLECIPLSNLDEDMKIVSILLHKFSDSDSFLTLVDRY